MSVRYCICCLAALFLTCLIPADASELLRLESVAYKSNSEAASAWRPMESSPPVSLSGERAPDGSPSLAMSFDMSRVNQRTYWDRAIEQDLSRYGRISFWVKVTGNSTAIAGSNLYLQSDKGWFNAGFALADKGWRRVALDRSAFHSEGKTAGWNVISSIRIGFWKGQPEKATVLISDITAESADVLVVRNAAAGPEPLEAAKRTSEMLMRAGIDATTVDDEDVERGALEGKRVAVFPDNPQPTQRELDALVTFVSRGGKLISFYALAPRVAALLGLDDSGWLGPKFAGQFSSIRRSGKSLPGLPEITLQASWNIEKVRPYAQNAQVVAEWFDSRGDDTGNPAIVVSDTGAYISHVLLNDDPDNKSLLLQALIGKLYPGLWHSLATTALKSMGRISTRWDTFTETEAGIQTLAAASGRIRIVQPEIAAAEKAGKQAQAAAARSIFPEAVSQAHDANRHLLSAYTLCQQNVPGEMRAIWCHSAYGVEGMSWDEAMKRLKVCGFNTIMPNLLWAGLADYRSKILPVSQREQKEGDQAIECLAAARKYGIAVHVWKVNWNLINASDTFVSRMRSGGRLQRSSNGSEIRWLCPSNEANFELERDSMLELVQNYRIDGLHFDYIRYPDSSGCYCDGCRARFEAQSGQKISVWPGDVVRGGKFYSAYQEFRRSNITKLVAAVSTQARAIQPTIKISAAVFPNWPECREEVGQDWGYWIKMGYVDFVCPMDYTDSDSSFRARISVQRAEASGKAEVIPGIGASVPGLSIAQVIDQIQVTRSEHSKGFIIFNYDPMVANELLPALARSTTGD